MNADGSLIATLYGSSVTVIDGRAGTLLGDITLDHAASNMAWSRSSPLLVASGDDRLSLVRAGSQLEVLRSAGAAGALWRLALSEQPPLVVAVARTSEHESALSAWHGEALEPLLGAEPLGATAAFTLLVDPSRRLVLLAGRKGRGGFSAGGDRFTGLVRLAEGSIEVLWKGEGLPFDPDGYLFPLAGGRLGIHSRDELVVLELPDDASGNAQQVLRAPLPEAESVAASPTGTLLAWRSEDAVRVARADTAEVVAVMAGPSDPGSFPALAVDDDGRVTVAASDRPNIVHVFGSDGDQLALRGDVEVPAEPG